MTTKQIAIVFGKAGSGKDTLARLMLDRLETFGIQTASVALADPMKRFCAQVFGWPEQLLWGPSEVRNGVAPGFESGSSELLENLVQAEERYENLRKGWLRNLTGSNDPRNAELLYNWFENCKKKAIKDGLSVRFALQQLGTEFGRAVSPEVWVRSVGSTCFDLLEGNVDYHRTLGKFSSPGKRIGFVVITDGRFQNEALVLRGSGGAVIKIVGRTSSVGNSHASESEMDSIPQNFFDYHVRNGESTTLERLGVKAFRLVNWLVGSTWV